MLLAIRWRYLLGSDPPGPTPLGRAGHPVPVDQKRYFSVSDAVRGAA